MTIGEQFTELALWYEDHLPHGGFSFGRDDPMSCVCGAVFGQRNDAQLSDAACEFLLDTLYAWSYAHPSSGTCRGAGEVWSSETCGVLDHLTVDVPVDVARELS